eukprot:TRINITY_DN3842_c0_g1_i1.p1 TRINITY_DN3842_c0_g1~~TRINITY_DN3842_c0_g1_i1.p1  ORF type:complete len:118 (-),score=5.97 TRINITY_DN3842_c0_g1_i1:64-417(-)
MRVGKDRLCFVLCTSIELSMCYIVNNFSTLHNKVSPSSPDYPSLRARCDHPCRSLLFGCTYHGYAPGIISVQVIRDGIPDCGARILFCILFLFLPSRRFLVEPVFVTTGEISGNELM